MPNPPVEALLTVAALAFVVAMAWTPLWAKFLYSHRLGKHIRDDGTTPIFTSLHGHKSGTPTMGGVLIWGTVAIVALGLHALALWLGPNSVFADLDFLTRRQTWLPLAALVAAGLVGLVDDWMNVRGRGASTGGLSMSQRLLLYTGIAVVGALWFYFKLGWDFLHVPFIGDLFVGWWYIPIFIFIIVSVAFSVNETDGLDGLAGGTLLMALASLSAIAFAQGKFQLATLCACLVGALLAFLWFNIPPARFFMGDTGAMALGVTVGIVAMLTNTVLLLPIIGFVFLIETLSVIIQLLSKKFRGKKVFKSAPLHHHLEASGWPESKIVMRLWVVGGVMGTIGVIIALVDKGLT
jgi:phospho-N-acetylmuramoyl-pentapeptide-transferase